MVNLHCECQELKPKGETNSSFLVLHPLSGVHTVQTVGSHLNIAKVVGDLQHRCSSINFEFFQWGVFIANDKSCQAHNTLF